MISLDKFEERVERVRMMGWREGVDFTCIHYTEKGNCVQKYSTQVVEIILFWLSLIGLPLFYKRGIMLFSYKMLNLL